MYVGGNGLFGSSDISRLKSEICPILPCNLCRRPTPHRPLFKKNGCEVVRCLRCRLVSTRAPRGFDPAATYDRAYFTGGRADGYADYAGSRRVIRAEFRSQLRRIERCLTPGDRILEVGSAYGYFLDVAAGAYDVHGIEISEHAAAVSRSRGHNVFCGEVGDAPFRPDSFQAVVLLDCVEHLPDPLGTLRSLRRLLCPGGILFLTTGNHDAILARWMGKRWRLMTPPQHLYFFSADTMRRLVRAAGFRVCDMRTQWKRVPVGLAAYQLSRTGVRLRPLEQLGRAGVPVNLFDTIQVLARRW